MIINHTFGFIFVHIPKSAGTTMTNILSRFSAYCDLEIGGTPLGEAIQPYFLKRFGLSKHSTASEIRRVVGGEIWQRYFSFALVRNPYDRAYSTYKFLKRWRNESMTDLLAVMDCFSSFREFVRSDYFLSAGLDRILNPQLFWLRTDEADARLSVDYVGRVESIEQALKQLSIRAPSLSKHLEAVKIPILNRSADSRDVDLKELLQDKSIESRIFEKYRVDFDTFGYHRSNGRYPAAHSPGISLFDGDQKTPEKPVNWSNFGFMARP